MLDYIALMNLEGPLSSQGRQKTNTQMRKTFAQTNKVFWTESG